MNNYKGKFFGFVFFCMLQAMLFSVNAFAATGVRYVAPPPAEGGIGNDGNNGLTAETPYATIQKAVEDLNVCSSVPAYPIYVPVGGGLVHLAAGTYPAPTSIIKAPISFVGDEGKANTFINVAVDKIGFHYSADGVPCAGGGTLYADHSKLSNLTIQSSSPSNIATGLRNDEAEWLILEDVDFKDFGTTYSGAKSPKEGPAAIYLSSIRTAPVVNTFGDWNIIKNVTISNSYRGIVSYSGVAGYMDNVKVENTGPGAALYMSKDDTEGLDAAIGWGVIDSHFENKDRLGILSPDFLPDAEHLVYIAHSNPYLSRFTADTQFYNSESTLTTSTPRLRHAYSSMGRVMWKNQSFTGGECGVELIDGKNGAWEMDGNDRNVVNGFESVPSRFDVASGAYFSYNRTGSSDICSYPYPVPATLAGLQAWFTAHPRTDTDHDGLIDDYESAIGNDPFNVADGANLNVGYLEDLVDTDPSKISNFYRFLHSPYLETSGSGGSNRWWDLDGDGLVFYTEYMNGTDPLMLDTDSDGINDGVDSFPVNASASIDTDSDGQPDSCSGSCAGGLVLDADDDNDTVLDVNDANPLIGIGSCTDADQDGAPDGATCGGMAADSDGYTVYGDNAANLLVRSGAAPSLVFYTINGLDGDDTLGGWTSNDTLNGGSGIDTVSYVNAATQVTVNLATGTTSGAGGVDTLVSIENIIGSNYLTTGDTLTGNASANVIDGGLGNDSMTGGAGNDTYIVNSTSDSITEAATVGEIDSVQSSATFTLQINVENLSLTGSSAINATGNASDNTLIGNTGNNTFSCLVGVDTISYASATSAVVFTLASTANQIVTGFGTDKLLSAADCENLITGSGNDTLNGNGSANTLTGNGGNDSLIGGAGVDAMIGGQGNDTYTVDNVNDVVTELASEGTDLVNSSVTYTILDADVESLTLTGSTNINATGNASNNLLTGNTGTNTLTGGAGDDTYVVQAADSVVENASEGTDLVQSAVAYTIIDTDVENLTLTGGGNVNATGNASANTLVGNTGANTLIGKEGSDTLTGGAGIDKFVMDDVLTPSIVTDFVKGTDKVVVDISDVGAGDADAVVEGGLSRASSGGFSGATTATNELVIFTTDIVGAVDATSAATAIGSASTTMAVGMKKIFVVDNGTNSYVYRFTSAANDVTVTTAELVLLATLNNVNDSGTGDYLFQP